jgi:CO/xanthine dehydrogenase Mo-binding subunit
MLYGRILGSPYPFARITSIDTSQAEKVPGVRAVITAKDVPSVRFSGSVEDQYALPCDNIVRKVDDPVAAVAAETIEVADEAISLIQVDYEDFTPILTVAEAHSPDPPGVVHPNLRSYTVNPALAASFKWDPEKFKDRPNVVQTYKIRTGDIDEGFKEADVIIENAFESVRGHHCHLENSGSICWVDSEGIINVLGTCQAPFMLRSTLSRIFGLPEESFRMISPWAGGGFGNNWSVKDEPIGIVLAQKTGRPVKIIKTRRETFTTTECRYKVTARIKDGFKKDGKLVARQMDVKEDMGAYSQAGGMLVKSICFGAVGTYHVPNFWLDSAGAYTNLPRASLLRGVGTPEIQWAIEQQMDIAAKKLGVDPVTVRKKNMLKKGQEDVCGQVMKSTGAEGCLDKAAEVIGINEKIAQDPGPWKKGRGIALGSKYSIPGQGSAAAVRVFADGTVEVRHNAHAMGQGTHHCLAQIAAEEFRLPIEKVRAVRGDSATTPYDAGSYSSRSMFHSGNALLKACADAKRQMFAIAAPLLGVPSDELDTQNSKIYRKSLPAVSIPVSDLFTRIKSIALEGSEIVGKGSYISPVVAADENGHSPRSTNYYAHIAYGAEVSVNEETGEARVLKIVGVCDNGQPINLEMSKVQIEGGIGMGVGLALYEEMKFDNGIPINPSFMDYKLPTVKEIPVGEDMVCLLNPDPHDEGPFGAKGMGEVVLSAIEPAIANAVYDAVGVRLPNPPLSRERIWRAIQEKKADNPE